MDKWFPHALQSRQSNTGKPDKSTSQSQRPSTTEPRTKRPRVESSSDIVALVTAVGELSLETARKERLHSGGLFRTFLVPPHEVFEDPLRVTQTASGADQSQDYVLAWASLVLALAQATLPSTVREAQNVLQAHAANTQDISALRDAVCSVVSLTLLTASASIFSFGQLRVLPRSRKRFSLLQVRSEGRPNLDLHPEQPRNAKLQDC
ncbi:unnamed protein product [Polarella glacialis]|uniref:Uncharacterized protein n=1 Tax=Polarella glacialis TaxID=89957 RepID=A0A813D7A2_POLGL|nr:unnamed protein product [Polarella glacialis]